jgi:hypothetical protein
MLRYALGEGRSSLGRVSLKWASITTRPSWNTLPSAAFPYVPLKLAFSRKAGPMSKPKEYAPLSRANFLRLTVLGAGGLGLTALAGCGSKTVITEGARQDYLNTPLCLE